MLKSTQTVTALGLVIQVVGFLRTMMIAAALGVSVVIDAYNLGIIAPTFIATVLGGWLQVGFVGRYAGLVGLGEDVHAADYRTKMLVLVAVIASALAAVCSFFPEPIMAMFMSGQDVTRTLAADALRIAAWTLVPVLTADFIGLVLNSHGRFFAAAFAPLLNAVVSILGLWLWPSIDLGSLLWTLLMGAGAQLAFVIWALSRLQLDYSANLHETRGEVLATVMVALPILPAIMLANSAAAIIQFQASELGDGAVSIFGYASRLHAAVSQILVMGLSTVLLPHFASLWSRGETVEIVRLLRIMARVATLLIGVLTLGIFLMGQDAIALLLGRGAFGREEADAVGRVWAVLSLGLFPFALGTFIAKLAQATRNTRAILATGFVSFAAVFIVSYVGVQARSIELVSASSTVAFASVLVAWLYWMARNFEAKPVLMDIGVAALMSAPILAFMAVSEGMTAHLAGDLPLFINLCLRGTAFLTTGAGLVALLGLRGWYFSDAPLPFRRNN
ncbi:murein biosynthesis integral membrane protein MurJ [Pseudaminobacter sp. NGMCC 1.201702]|uniref:murein biosynthesis integral membrane protein MurJ n=1 Tax=Pseudaminobacter sp. NGMCC 1.201702 TaxID=3391825 RepID=UPI0039EFBB96